VTEAQRTFDLDQRAWNLYRHSPERPVDADGNQPKLTRDDKVWLKPIVDLVLESSRRPLNLAVLPLGQRLEMGQSPTLDELLWEDAHLHEDDGEPDLALDIYIGLLRRDAQLAVCHRNPAVSAFPSSGRIFSAICNWSAAAGQTTEQIRVAIQQLKTWHAALPPAEALLRTPYETAELVITDLPKALAESLTPPEGISEIDWLSSRMPWERERAMQLLNVLASEQLTEMRFIERSFEDNEPTARWGRGRGLSANDWLSTTPLVRTSVLAHPSLDWFVLCRETNYRATLIILALEAWKIEHGQLPDTLSELAGSLLDTVPLDPRFAQPFLYYPQGIAELPSPAPAAHRAAADADAESDRRLPIDRTQSPVVAAHWVYPSLMSGRPFLWSALNQDHYDQRVDLRWMGTGQEGYCRDYGGDVDPDHPDPRFAFDVLEAGHDFPIPSREEKQP
jgi:hypothetical protein